MYPFSWFYCVFPTSACSDMYVCLSSLFPMSPALWTVYCCWESARYKSYHYHDNDDDDDDDDYYYHYHFDHYYYYYYYYYYLLLLSLLLLFLVVHVRLYANVMNALSVSSSESVARPTSQNNRKGTFGEAQTEACVTTPTTPPPNKRDWRATVVDFILPRDRPGHES